MLCLRVLACNGNSAGETQNKYRYSETGRHDDEDRAKRNEVPNADVKSEQ